MIVFGNRLEIANDSLFPRYIKFLELREQL